MNSPSHFVTVRAHLVDRAIAHGVAGLVLATGETFERLAKDAGMLYTSRVDDATPLACDPTPRRMTAEEREAWTAALADAKTRWPWVEGGAR